MLPALDQTIPVAQMVRFATVNDGGRATGMKFAGQGFPPRNVASMKHYLFDANRVITFYFDNRPHLNGRPNFITSLLLRFGLALPSPA